MGGTAQRKTNRIGQSKYNQTLSSRSQRQLQNSGIRRIKRKSNILIGGGIPARMFGGAPARRFGGV